MQNYESGAKPGMDALVTLARVANVDMTWLVLGRGQMRPSGMQSGAVLKDVVTVDQYELGTSLAMQIVIGQIPFSRHLLEVNLRLREPTRKTLLVVEAGSNLLPIVRGDLVLVDLRQASFARDGVYLIDLPGLELRAMSRRPDGKIDVVGPEYGVTHRDRQARHGNKRRPGWLEMPIRDLFGQAHKVIGRAVWVGRAI